MNQRTYAISISFVLILLSTVFVTKSQAGADSDYWVDYQVVEMVRSQPTDPWTPRYSDPFGVRLGYGGGVTLTDRTLTDPKVPNCYSFSFTPNAVNGLASLQQELEITEYHGDAFCTPSDPQKISRLALIDLTVLQNETTTLELPFIEGEEVKVELTQTWKIVP
jgi:hypothetical protein